LCCRTFACVVFFQENNTKLHATSGNKTFSSFVFKNLGKHMKIFRSEH